MSNYRRTYVPGACYFFTVVTWHRRPLFDQEDNINLLRLSLKMVMQQRPFRIDAIVVLPDHIHCLWKMPKNDSDYSGRWRAIKQHVSSKIDTPVNRRKEKQVWQPRFWEHLIRDEKDWIRHMDYIHYNPVKHGLVKKPIDWRTSSFHRSVKRGWYTEDWGTTIPDGLLGMERE